MKIKFEEIKKYPGGEIIAKGLKDIGKGIFNSIEALALLIASPRLNDLGFDIPNEKYKEPNILLYKKLGKKFGNDAHYQYNSMMQRVNKFCNSF